MKYVTPITILVTVKTVPAVVVAQTDYHIVNRSLAQRRLSQIKSNTDFHSINKNHRILIRDNTRLPKLTFPDQLIGEEEEMKDCDIAFFDCIAEDVCSTCFIDMSTNAVDWAGVTPDTECSTVVQTLQKNNFCKSLTILNQATFCKTFRSCVVFDDNETGKNRTVDCDSLTACDWPGIHPAFIGDGVCHDSYFDSCYNTAICNYDGGDCCKDTCKKPQGAYLECGSDGYACRDTKSTECNPTLSLQCPPSSYKKTSDDNNPITPTCSTGETLYRIVMYDSFGDGWEQTEMTITPQATSTSIFKGGLKSGAEGTVYICMSINPTCYDVTVLGGNWGREASWYIRGFSEGSPAIASGGGAMDCSFPVVGSTSCTNTCTGAKSNIDPTLDPDYKDLKNMTKCIDEKCIIQMSECQNSPSCQSCFVEDVPDYCFSVPSFLAVSDCAMCKCTFDDTDGIADYCNGKQAPGIIIPTPKDGVIPAKPVPCTPAETLTGTDALLAFSKCMNYDKTPLMMTDFDSNNFGHIDQFESCAHKFAATPDHSGVKALDCMQILVDAINEDAKDGLPTKLISQLAKDLYNDGLQFCDCAKTASTDAPLCPSFYNFKTLLYESVDACMALDEIDCDAWDEFQKPCQVNLKSKFGRIDFTRPDQCDYVKSNCGDSGPFPSFRHLDCQREIPLASWQFYNDYTSGCLHDTSPAPAPAPTSSPILPSSKSPTPDRDVKPSNLKPVIPTPYNNGPPSTKKSSYKSPDEKNKKSHWFRNTIFILFAVGIAYYLYKRQSDGFNFVRYRRMTNFSSSRNAAFGMMDSNDGDMYSGLSLESSTNFEPPTLPPTPMFMPSNGGYGA